MSETLPAPADRPADIRLTLQRLERIVALGKQLRERMAANVAEAEAPSQR